MILYLRGINNDIFSPLGCNRTRRHSYISPDDLLESPLRSLPLSRAQRTLFPAYCSDKLNSYQRVEFLDDAVHENAAISILQSWFPSLLKGTLCELRSGINCKLMLQSYCLMYKMQGHSAWERYEVRHTSLGLEIIADCFEALQ